MKVWEFFLYSKEIFNVKFLADCRSFIDFN